MINVAAECISHPTLIKSQYGPDLGQYLTDFDKFGVVEKPSVPSAKFIK